MKKLAVTLLAILLALITLFVIDAAMTPANTPLDAENLTPQEYNMAVAANEVKENQLFDFTPYLVQPDLACVPSREQMQKTKEMLKEQQP